MSISDKAIAIKQIISLLCDVIPQIVRLIVEIVSEIKDTKSL